MKKIYTLLFLIIISIAAFAQNGKIIEKIKIATSADSVLKRTNPYYDTLKRILDNVDVYRITYISDGLKVKGYMDIPKKPGKYPCIIYNRGGNREFGKLKKWNYMGDMAEKASWGYCIVATQYRGNDGGEGKDEFAGKDLDDVMNMIPLLNDVDKADTTRIGMWGISRGGLMTYLALTKTNLIKAAVVVSGLVDLKQGVETQKATDTMFYNWLPEYRTDKEGFLKKRSAIAVADNICKITPIFIIQGTGDAAVTTPQVFDMTKKLYELKHPFRFALFEGGGHGVSEFEDEVTRQTKNFFDAYLRNKKRWPSLELHR